MEEVSIQLYPCSITYMHAHDLQWECECVCAYTPFKAQTTSSFAMVPTLQCKMASVLFYNVHSNGN